MKTIVKGGVLVLRGGTFKGDILLEDGVIKKIAPEIEDSADVAVDARGKHVFPGFIDMHVHLREPGFEYKEDIESGSRAAVAGGFSQVACMPNTNPVADNASVIESIANRGREVGLARINPIGAITVGEKGERLAEMGKMKKAGAVAVSDDGKSVPTAEMMKIAMEYASDFGLLPLAHCEDLSLTDGGSVNESLNGSLSGIKGITSASEEVIVAREIILSKTLGKPVHLCHISTAGSVDMVREAKKRGIKVSAETCPHYFSLTDEAVLSYDTFTKVNPPLRTDSDVEAIIQGLKDGTIDAIATDHAPHHRDDKRVEYGLAAFGISGLETAFSLAYTNLVKPGHISLERLAELMAYNPASLLKVCGGEIKEGGAADLAVADLGAEYTVDGEKFFSKGKNTPFNGKKLCGKIYCTVVNGEIKYLDGEIK